MRFSTAILAATSLLTCLSQAYAPTHQFDQTSSTWYPYIQGILHGKCPPEFTSYQHRNTTAGSPKDRTLAVLNYVLGELSEYHKANIAASVVMLGAAPMILQTLGSMTAETGLLSLRRPFLSPVLAAGSPAVVAQKGSEFIEMLSRYVGEGETRFMGLPGFRWRSVPFGYRPLIGLAEYLVGGGAVANVIQLAYRLGRHAVVVFATDTTYLPPLWTFLAVVIHLSGALVLHLRVKVARSKVTGKKQIADTRRGRLSWVPDEFVPSAYQTPSKLVWRRDHVLFYGGSWFLSVLTVTHVIFGTMVFSSLLFFAVRDAIVIVCRYAASSIVCRAVVRLELSGMKEVTMTGDVDGSDDEGEAVEDTVRK